MSESKIKDIINKGNNLVNKIKDKKNKKQKQLIDITKDYDKIYDDETKLRYDNAKEEVLNRWTEALKEVDIEGSSELELFNILQKIREDVAAENDLFSKSLTFNGGKKRRRTKKRKSRKRKSIKRNKKKTKRMIKTRRRSSNKKSRKTRK